MIVLTQYTSGVLLPQTGWYPVGSDPEIRASRSSADENIDLGLDSPSIFDNYVEKIPVRNTTLSTFIQSLRPAIDSLQADLMLEIFKSAPELTADYFSKKDKFASEPQDSPGWLGQSAFLFSVVQLPIPPFCGWNEDFPTMPPPSTIVLESILPRPLDRATMTRCLNLNHEVITLFAARVLTVAFQKLQRTLDLFLTAKKQPRLWVQAIEKLTVAFGRRCPLLKDVIHAFHRASKTELQLRHALIELVLMYFRSFPDQALAEKFDVSLALTDAIGRLKDDEIDGGAKETLLKQLTNLVHIAQASSNIRWWQKPGE